MGLVPTQNLPARSRPLQLDVIKTDITGSIADLKRRNHIIGEPPTLDEFLEPTEEQEIGQSLKFEGGDIAIVAAVTQEMAEKNGEVIEVDSDGGDEDTEPEISRKETHGKYFKCHAHPLKASYHQLRSKGPAYNWEMQDQLSHSH